MPNPEDQAGNTPEGVSIFDESFERSVINIVPEEFKNAMLRARADQGAYFQMTEDNLRKKVDPDSQTNRLKLSFWDEYNRSQAMNKRMHLGRVYFGICTKDFFYAKVLHTTQKIAWICTPPRDLFLIQRDMLERGIEEEDKILRMPNTMKVGKRTVTDHKLIGLKLQIIRELKLRVLGAIPTVTKNLNVNWSAKGPSSNPAEPQTSMDDLARMREQIAQIEGEIDEGSQEKVIDAQSEDFTS